MITRVMFIILVAAFMLSSLSNAEEANYAITPPIDSTQGKAQPAKVQPAVVQKFTQNVREAVDIKNIAETFNQAPIYVKYDKKGLIDAVTLKDGTKVAYTYTYDKEGELSSVRLTSDSLILEFRAAEDKNDKPDNPPDFLPQDYGSKDKSDDKGKGEEPPNNDDQHTNNYSYNGNDKLKEQKEPPVKKPDVSPVIIYVPDDTLKQIARKPIDFDFDKVKDGFDKALKEKNKAYEEYAKNTAPYYDKILNELAGSADGLKAEGVKVDLSSKNKNPDGSIDAGQRKNIDAAVQEIGRLAKEGRGATRQAERFIALERILANEFLSPNRQIFEDKIKQAVDYVNKIIDAVIKSKLAVYLNANKDKIEAIVNLPEAKNK